jgi:AcrR family transcriptional regulator
MKKILLPGLIRRKKRVQDRRQSIIQAAIQVLSEKGYEQTTMQDIAEMADLSTSSVYYYFESKLAILEEAFNVLAEDIASTTESILQSSDPQLSSTEPFMRRLDYFRKFNLIALLAEAEHSPELLPRVTGLIQNVRIELQRRMQALNERNELSIADPEIAAEMMLCIGFGAIMLDGISQESSPNIKKTENILNIFNSLLVKNSPQEMAQNSNDSH